MPLNVREPRSVTHRHGIPTTAFLAALVLATTSTASAERLVSDGIVLPPTSIATDQSTAALFVNPANIGLSSTSISYIHEDGSVDTSDARRGDALIGLLGGQVLGDEGAVGVALGVEWLRPRGIACDATAPCLRRTSLGVSAGTGSFSLGASWHGFSSGEDAELDRLDTFDVGLTLRPTTWLSIAATAETLNAPTVALVRQPRQYALGVGLRPFGAWLTLGADALVDDRGGFDEISIRTLGRAALFEGVDVVAGVTPTRRPAGRWETSVALGLSLGFGYASLEGAAKRPSNGRFFDSSSYRAQMTKALGPAIGGTALEAHVVDVGKAISPDRSLLSLIRGVTDDLDPYTRLVLQLQRLSPDEGAGAVVLVLRSGMGLSFGRIEELRELVRTLQSRGTKVVAWLSGGDDAAYYLALACDRIVAMPQSLLELNGLSSTRFYLAHLLDKIGVNAEFVKIGRYKSAPEQFTNSQASESAEEETRSILHDQSERYIHAIAEARGLGEAQARTLLSSGGWLSEEALEKGLIDAVAPPGPRFSDEMTRVAGRRLKERRAGPDARVSRDWGTAPAVALVEVTGNIMPGSGTPGSGGGAESVAKRLRQAAQDPGVRAIVLRVDSPGGDVTASELIWAAVEEAKLRKPVIASFGDVAASGGYYVASGADVIFAAPGTITGSIGVFAGKADLSGLLAKIGVTTQHFALNDEAELFTPTRAWTPQERTRVETIVEGFYETFLQRVAIGRKMSRDAVHSVAQGRVWTGAQARERGLVDELGGLQSALTEARKRAGLPSDAPVRVLSQPGLHRFEDVLLSEPPSPAVHVMSTLVGLVGGRSLDARETRELGPLLNALAAGRPLALAIDLPGVR